MTRTELLQAAKPILFNTEMVRAILDGCKTVTRRVIKQKVVADVLSSPARLSHPSLTDKDFVNCLCDAPYDTDDVLWVRETWWFTDCFGVQNGYMYRANFDPNKVVSENTTANPKWRPSIHMPKEAARLFLRVTGVWVERLQNMDVSQCVREGVTWNNYPYLWTHEAKPAFVSLWNSTIKKSDLDRYGWNANPWVWVIEFERVIVK